MKSQSCSCMQASKAEPDFSDCVRVLACVFLRQQWEACLWPVHGRGQCRLAGVRGSNFA